MEPRPLHHAAIDGGLARLRALLATGVDVDAMDFSPGGRTALRWAAFKGQTACLEALLAAGASVDVGGSVTPLHSASAAGQVACVRALIAAGADVNRACQSGQTPCVRTPFTAALQFGRRSILKILLRAGADVNQPACKVASPVRGVTPLQRARFLCSSGRKHGHAGSAAHAVLAHGAPWSRKTHRFYPPKVRARVAELMVIGQRFKRADRFLLELWEAFVIPHLVAADVWRHWRSIELGPDDSTEG